MRVLQVILFTERVIAFKRYNFICHKQKKNELLEQFHADLMELASRADCGDREDDGFGIYSQHTRTTKKSQRNF